MRDASTYRGARRNAALRGDNPEVWGRSHYYGKHAANYGRRTVLSKRPSRYHPLESVGNYLRGMGKAWGRRVRAPAINKAAPRGQ